MIKYGKSNDILLSKKISFQSNDKLVAIEKMNIEEYKKSLIRKDCINCQNSLQSVIFKRHDVQYFQCDVCGHINGEFQITSKFNNYLYNSSAYDENYLEFDENVYLKRVEDIYLPKADFLLDALIDDNQTVQNLSFFDYGCGSGYFIHALKQKNINKISGSDVSKSQIELGNKMLYQYNPQTHIPLLESNSLDIRTGSVDCLSLIGVLEHLESPNNFLHNIQNLDITYLYVLLPTFSLSDYLQISFPKVYERHLGSGHTHLYTENSIKYFFEKYNYQIISQWWFGGDIFDLFRSICTTLEKENGNTDIFTEYFTKMVDDLQIVLDKHHKCSEVHILLKKIENDT